VTADGIRVLVQVPLQKAATAAGVPQWAADVEAGVIAAFVTEPVTRPIADRGTLIEIAGVIIGFVANIHPLALACANRLAKKKITDLVAKGIVEVMSSLAGATTATNASAEEAAASQLDPQDPVGAEPCPLAGADLGFPRAFSTICPAFFLIGLSISYGCGSAVFFSRSGVRSGSATRALPGAGALDPHVA